MSPVCHNQFQLVSRSLTFNARQLPHLSLHCAKCLLCAIKLRLPTHFGVIPTTKKRKLCSPACKDIAVLRVKRRQVNVKKRIDARRELHTKLKQRLCSLLETPQWSSYPGKYRIRWCNWASNFIQRYCCCCSCFCGD